MKKLSFLLILIAIGCQNEQVTPGSGTATFSMSAVARNAGGRVSQTSTPMFALISIEDANGKLILQNKKLNLYSFGQGYVSESLQLNEGNYKLTQFQILNAHDTVIYASPMAGSALAQYVTNPLPINFTITKNATTEVVPQVLEVSSNDTPENFGYVSFGFEVIKKISLIKIFENSNSAPNTFLLIGVEKFEYSNGLLSKKQWYDEFGNITRIDYFEYDLKNQLISKKTDLPNIPDHFYITLFEHDANKTTIHRYETVGSWKSPEEISSIIKTSTGFQYSSSNINIEYKIDNLGNVISQSTNGFICDYFKYDSSPNPVYFPDGYEDLTNWGYLSKNNLIATCEMSYTFQYYPDGLPKSKIVNYQGQDALRYEYSYLP